MGVNSWVELLEEDESFREAVIAAPGLNSAGV